MHILVLADRDWTHPEGGGSGQNLRRQVEQFRSEGHRVSVISSGYPGSRRLETIDGVELHHLGSRTTVFPAAAWAVLRGCAAEADVVLEVINGITFLTPLWLRRPRVALVHHVHAGAHYVEEMGRIGRPLGALLETLPLRGLYRDSAFVCVSRATQDGLIASGIPRRQITVAYNGVDSEMFVEPRRAERPTFVVLGRLKRYKRIELVLQAVAAIPDVQLEIIGDGSHREALSETVRRMGLEQRVRFHGHVDEPTKREMLRSSWAHVTASAAEGWGLTIAEAAACGTPSAGLATGGLREAIVHERTGLLARDAEDLSRQLTRLATSPELVEQLGANAQRHVQDLTWQRAAATTLDVLERARSQPTKSPGIRARTWLSDGIRAAGLAFAVLVNTALALACTVVFARWLGTDRYGTLASLLSCFLILTIPGCALQAAVARDVSRDPEGRSRELAQRAPAAVLLLALPLGLVLVLTRAQLGAVLGVHPQWGAAAALWFGWLWIGLSLKRGLLQGQARYGAIGLSLVIEAAGRMLFGIGLVALGLGATGALLGTGCAIAAAWTTLSLLDRGHRALPQVGDLWRLTRRAGAPLLALSLLAVLQNADVILVRHQMPQSVAGLYSEAAIAARGILWFAVGLGLFLLPEAARLARRGDDPRRVLAQMIGLVVALALPLIALYAVAGASLLHFVFGAPAALSTARADLALLSIAMTLLAVSYLAVQYLLALGRRVFALPLAAACLAQVGAVLAAGRSFEDVAIAILAVQVLLLLALLRAALGARARAPAVEELPAPAAVLAVEEAALA
ncbi:MAG: glycosyltransferase [Solirubrobacteraceae bacterium]